MKPLVSVIIPCFNAEAHVGEALESVFAQTWPNLEVIVVDDGSTDRSADVVRRVGGERVRLIRQANRGQSAALNAGLQHVSGQFVQYLDADDLIDPDKIERQATRLLDHPECVASAQWGRFCGDSRDTAFVSEAVYQDLAPLDWLALSRADGLGMMMPALWLIPAGVVRAAGPWREALTLNNDAEYFTRVLLQARRVLFCPGARCRYRSGQPNSVSAQKGPAHLRSQVEVFDRIERLLLDAEPSERFRRALALSWQHLAHISHPYDSALAREALQRARALHPIEIRPDGGQAFRALSALLGWRMARRLQVLSGRA